MSEKTPSANNRPPARSSDGADKAIAALGGGILGAGAGGGVLGVLIGCALGYGVGYLAEKNAKERKSKDD